MATKYHQISLKETFDSCQDMFIDDTPSFFRLLSEHMNLHDFIPVEFSSAFISLSVGSASILAWFSLCAHSTEDFFLPYRFPAYPSAIYLQGITGFLRVFQSS